MLGGTQPETEYLDGWKAAARDLAANRLKNLPFKRAEGTPIEILSTDNGLTNVGVRMHVINRPGHDFVYDPTSTLVIGFDTTGAGGDGFTKMPELSLSKYDGYSTVLIRALRNGFSDTQIFVTVGLGGPNVTAGQPDVDQVLKTGVINRPRTFESTMTGLLQCFFTDWVATAAEVTMGYYEGYYNEQVALFRNEQISAAQLSWVWKKRLTVYAATFVLSEMVALVCFAILSDQQ